MPLGLVVVGREAEVLELPIFLYQPTCPATDSIEWCANARRTCLKTSEQWNAVNFSNLAWLAIQSKRIQMMQLGMKRGNSIQCTCCAEALSKVLISLWTTPLQDASWIAVATYSSSAKKKGKQVARLAYWQTSTAFDNSNCIATVLVGRCALL